MTDYDIWLHIEEEQLSRVPSVIFLEAYLWVEVESALYLCYLSSNYIHLTNLL